MGAPKIHAADFAPTRWDIQFENSTSGFKLPRDEPVSLLEVGDKNLVFELPEKCCVATHHVLMRLKQARGVALPLRFEFTGKVLQAEKVGGGRMRVTVELQQYDEGSWKKFVDHCDEGQERINRFLKAARGE